MTLYMLVTPDEYELPMAVVDHVVDLTQITGKTKGNILSQISRNKSGKRNGFKVIKVEVDDENDGKE